MAGKLLITKALKPWPHLSICSEPEVSPNVGAYQKILSVKPKAIGCDSFIKYVWKVKWWLQLILLIWYFSSYPLKAPLGFAVELFCWNWKWSLCFKVNKKGRVGNIQFKGITMWSAQKKCSCRSGRTLLMRRKTGEEKKSEEKCVKGLKLYQLEQFLNHISK